MEEQILDTKETSGDIRHLVAPKGTRFANLLVDNLLIGIPLSFLCNFMIFGEYLATRPSHLDLENQLKVNALYFVLHLLYFILMEHFFGKTVGKMMTNTRVVTHNGGKPSLGQIIGRSFARLIPFEAFSFLGETGIGWHDSLSKTYVIKGK